MTQSDPSKVLCVLTLVASIGYILSSLLLQEVNLGSLGVTFLVMVACLAGLSSDGACESRVRAIPPLLLASVLLASSMPAPILPYILLLIYPLVLYLVMDGSPYTLLASIVLLFAIVEVFSGNLFLFGRDTTHHTIRVMEIIKEGKLPTIKFVDPMYRYFPFYHLLHVTLSEVTGIHPAFPFVFSLLTYGISGLIVIPYLISKAIGESSLVPGLLLIGLPLTLVFVISPIPEAYSIVLCLIFLLFFLKTPSRGDIVALLMLSTSSFLYHPVPTFIFIGVSIFLSLKPHTTSGSKKPKIFLLLIFTALLYASYSLGLIERLILPLIRGMKPTVIRDFLALKVIAYSIDLSNPVNSFLMLVNYALLVTLAMISLRRRNQVVIFLSSLVFILLGITFSLIFHTTAFYRYFGTPVLFLLAVLAGQGLRRLSCKKRWGFLAPILIAIFTSSFVIGVLIPPSQPLSQETAYLFKGMPREQDIVASSFLGKYASNTISVDYRIEPAVTYYMASYGNRFNVRVFSPRKANLKVLDLMIREEIIFLRKDAILEMGIIEPGDIENLNRLVLGRSICYSSEKALITSP
ncbi:MAG: hypothetical protein J7J65_05785 [Candidatus Korarchaeota archaeon]|nr:hypothetical protein [Candidatus Korarchaeota archaeon]